MTSKGKQEYAYLLYSKANGMSLNEIAEKVGVHVNTISRWKAKHKWDELRETLLTTRQEQLRRLYMQLKELNDHIMEKETGKRFANKAEADSMIQITRSIANLEKDMTAATVIDVFIKFIEYASKIDSEVAKKILEIQDLYIKTLIK